MKTAITRLVVLVVLLVNQTLITLGWSPLPFSEEEIYEGVSAAATALMAIYTWYRNNNVSKEAQESQKILDAKKVRKKAQDKTNK